MCKRQNYLTIHQISPKVRVGSQVLVTCRRQTVAPSLSRSLNYSVRLRLFRHPDVVAKKNTKNRDKMDSNPTPSTSFGDEMDADTKPLVMAKDRAMLSRQAPVELGSRVMSPAGAEDGAPGGEGAGGGPDHGPATRLTHRR